jgi:hypothetical protein
MDLLDEEIVVDLTNKKLKELIFLYNALENGWTIKKKKEIYIFSRKHHNKKEVYDNEYLQKFIDNNSQITNKLLQFIPDVK